jgi:hypothetical protein
VAAIKPADYNRKSAAVDAARPRYRWTERAREIAAIAQQIESPAVR